MKSWRTLWENETARAQSSLESMNKRSVIGKTSDILENGACSQRCNVVEVETITHVRRIHKHLLLSGTIVGKTPPRGQGSLAPSPRIQAWSKSLAGSRRHRKIKRYRWIARPHPSGGCPPATTGLKNRNSRAYRLQTGRTIRTRDRNDSTSVILNESPLTESARLVHLR